MTDGVVELAHRCTAAPDERNEGARLHQLRNETKWHAGSATIVPRKRTMKNSSRYLPAPRCSTYRFMRRGRGCRNPHASRRKRAALLFRLLAPKGIRLRRRIAMS
jgi:hypothetical protein